ncbi:MAG: aldehyde dehydrogenase family protein, partial [Rhodobacteraceae bacterium]|nr:aldehyde dehydrogenase family protein [Paracoccaceae bacterium]
MNVREIFDSMAYGPAPESNAEVLAWLGSHKTRFGHWIDGAYTAPGEVFETRNPATGVVLAEVTQGTAADVDRAVAAARRAQVKWARLPGHARARVL